MSFTPDDIKKVAHLARLNLTEDDIACYMPQMTNILNFIAQMNETQTDQIEAMAHPLDLSQRLREDVITEADLRKKYQSIAPLTEAGLYLVPKVIE